MAGVAALYLSDHRTASAQELKDALLATASLRKIRGRMLPGTVNRLLHWPFPTAAGACYSAGARDVVRLRLRSGLRCVVHLPLHGLASALHKATVQAHSNPQQAPHTTSWLTSLSLHPRCSPTAGQRTQVRGSQWHSTYTHPPGSSTRLTRRRTRLLWARPHSPARRRLLPHHGRACEIEAAAQLSSPAPIVVHGTCTARSIASIHRNV